MRSVVCIWLSFKDGTDEPAAVFCCANITNLARQFRSCWSKKEAPAHMTQKTELCNIIFHIHTIINVKIC
jgi:hypothetical protein